MKKQITAKKCVDGKVVKVKVFKLQDFMGSEQVQKVWDEHKTSLHVILDLVERIKYKAKTFLETVEYSESALKNGEKPLKGNLVNSGRPLFRFGDDMEDACRSVYRYKSILSDVMDAAEDAMLNAAWDFEEERFTEKYLKSHPQRVVCAPMRGRKKGRKHGGRGGR